MTESIPGYRHEALMYAGRDGFLDGTLPFIEGGLESGEPVLVAVDRPKIDLLRSRLDGEAERVGFIDITELGRNPACIIPAWRDFVAEHAPHGRAIRGIGEPIWPERSADELVECQHHEALLNIAFEGDPDFWLLCPYDVSRLEPDVVRVACDTHPLVVEDGCSRSSDTYAPPGLEPLEEPLPEPGAPVSELDFDEGGDLAALRSFVAGYAEGVGFDTGRRPDLVAAANELATNSLRHAGGGGILRLWCEAERLVCEVTDRGRIHDALVGRALPPREHPGGRGLWLVNHLCDLVQIRSAAGENVVRLHMRLS